MTGLKFKGTYSPVMIAATHVKELNIIELTDTGLRVGSSVTLTTFDQALKQHIAQLNGNPSFFQLYGWYQSHFR